VVCQIAEEKKKRMWYKDKEQGVGVGGRAESSSARWQVEVAKETRREKDKRLRCFFHPLCVWEPVSVSASPIRNVVIFFPTVNAHIHIHNGERRKGNGKRWERYYIADVNGDDCETEKDRGK
jgi:hypothetical protein